MQAEGMDDIDASDKTKPTSLLDLPAELWCKIGKLAVNDEGSITVSDIEDEWRKASGGHGVSEIGQPPAIAQTCRVMRQELLPYFFQTKVLELHLNPDNKHMIRSWLQAMDKDDIKHIVGTTVSYEACAAGWTDLETYLPPFEADGQAEWDLSCEGETRRHKVKIRFLGDWKKLMDPIITARLHERAELASYQDLYP